MEYFIGVVSVISLILNALMYRRITTTYVVGSVEEFEASSAHWCQCEATKPVESEVHVTVNPPKSEPKPAQSNSAWENRTGIPVGPERKPEPALKPITRGPLERPDGFI
jgi:F420-dependent methylenetetrahydromethanopterin dehydrogenase